jgi:hypothetical protein
LEKWNGGPVTLSWEELKDPANGAKYGYNASAITDTSIGDMALSFSHPEADISVALPSSITYIGECALHSAKSLTFNGTIEQWDAINKNEYWNVGVGIGYRIVCSNGETVS